MAAHIMTNSWVIVSRDTGKPVFETFSRKVADAVNTKKYEVLTALQWLQRFNAQVRKQNPLRKRAGPAKGRVPPHLRRYLFKKGHR